MKKYFTLSIQLAIGIFLPFTVCIGALIQHFSFTPGIVVLILFLLFFCVYWYWLLQTKIRDRFLTVATLLESSAAGEHSIRDACQNWDTSYSLLTSEINKLSDTLQKKQNEITTKSTLLKKILDKIPVAIMTFNPNMQVTLANPHAAGLFDCIPETLLYRSANELKLDEILELKNGVVSHNFPAENGKWQIEVTQFYNSGEENQLLLITNLTQTLREETLQAWQKLIRVIAHEINNSLAPIQSTTQTVSNLLSKENISNADLICSGLELITERSEHLHGFINSYSKVTKLPKPNAKPVALISLLDHLKALYPEQTFKLKGVLNVTLEIDAVLVQQALINVVKNAMESMENSQGVIEFEGEIKKNKYILKIKDQGHGVANPENILTPFYTTKSKGSGIGLTLGRQIIEAHNGTLSIQNRPDGIGAEVILYFRVN